MSLSDARRALQVNGRICWNPTDLSIAYPHGGTALGFMRGHALETREGKHVVRAEELGVAIEAIRAGIEYVLAVILSSWDVDAVTTLSHDAAAGSVTGRPVLRGRVGTANARQGEKFSAKAGILYFSPDADQHPGVLLFNALPMRAENAKSAFNLAEKFGYPLAFMGTPDATNRIIEVGLREDLVL